MLQASPRVEYEDTYTFEDGAKLHVTLGGSYLLEDADGRTIVQGHDLRPSPMTRDTLDIAAALASFIGHDGDAFAYERAAGEPAEHYVFNDEALARWAMHHEDELSILATADEDREED